MLAKIISSRKQRLQSDTGHKQEMFKLWSNLISSPDIHCALHAQTFVGNALLTNEKHLKY